MTTCDCAVSQDCHHPWPIELDPAKIQAGDSIQHKPSGENWFLLGVDSVGNHVCAAGWPPSMAKLSDCTLVEKGKGITLYERNYRNSTFGGSWDDERTTR